MWYPYSGSENDERGLWSRTVGHMYNLSTQEAEAGGYRVKGQPGDSYLKNKIHTKGLEATAEVVQH
jgi:hypothetical protein